MIQTPLSAELHRQRALDNLAATGIRQLAPGGKARAIVDALADSLAELDNRKHADLYSLALPYATEESLDRIGDLFGVYRVQRQDVSVDAAEGTLVFYVRNGTFGSINGGADIVLPDGVRVSSTANNGPIYLTARTVLSAENSLQPVSAASAIPGIFGNVPAGTLVRHNFTGYQASSESGLLVTNANPITAGREREDDESYRYRIHLRLTSRNGVNEAAIRLALLDLPGVQDVIFVTQAGHFHVYLYSVTPVASPQLIRQAQDRINETAAYPIKGTVIQPDLVGISLYTTIRLVASATPTDKISASGAAVMAAEDYINNLGIGQPLIINELADRIRNADPKIIDVGEPNRQIPEIFLWRKRPGGTASYSRFLIGNYTPALGERIYVESSRFPAINVQAL